MLAQQNDPYQIQSKTAFYPEVPSKRRIPFRSLLEARWALTFDLMHIDWAYEPVRFELPTGDVYTPDFYLEEIGWVEIKPTMEALMQVEEKLHHFAHWKQDVVPEGFGTRFFSIDTGFPSFAKPNTTRSSVIEWVGGGVRDYNKQEALSVFCAPQDRAFKKEHPELYTDYVDRACTFAKDAYFDGPFALEEIVLVALKDLEQKALEFRNRKRLPHPKWKSK